MKTAWGKGCNAFFPAKEEKDAGVHYEYTNT
jgi:hypothetical protein